MARLWTLLALIALALMPLGMAAAPAMAEVPPAAAGHCEDHQQPAEMPGSAQAHCSGCALAPLETPAAAEPLPPQAPAQPALVGAFSGTGPGTDPPPPKRS